MSMDSLVEGTAPESSRVRRENRITLLSAILVVPRWLLVWTCVTLAFVEVLLTPRSRLRGAELVSRWSRAVLRCAGAKVRVEGSVPRGSTLLVSNHRSYIDVLALASAASCSFLCKVEVSRWPLIGAVARAGGCVFVDRKDAASRKQSLMRVRESLDAGALLSAFPEGTTTRGPQMLAMRPGLFRAAAEHDYSVTPVVLEYGDARDAWVDSDTLLGHCLGWLARPRSVVRIRFGDQHFARAGDAVDLQARVADWMGAALQELSRP